MVVKLFFCLASFFLNFYIFKSFQNMQNRETHPIQPQNSTVINILLCVLGYFLSSFLPCLPSSLLPLNFLLIAKWLHNLHSSYMPHFPIWFCVSSKQEVECISPCLESGLATCSSQWTSANITPAESLKELACWILAYFAIFGTLRPTNEQNWARLVSCPRQEQHKIVTKSIRCCFGLSN